MSKKMATKSGWQGDGACVVGYVCVCNFPALGFKLVVMFLLIKKKRNKIKDEHERASRELR